MSTALAPASGPRMAVGRVLSQSFAIVSDAPLVFFGTSLLLTALPSLAARFAMPSLAQPFTGAPGVNPFVHIWPTMLGLGIVWLLLYEAAKIVLIRAAVAGCDGRPEPVGAYLATVPGTLLPLLGLTILLSTTLADYVSQCPPAVYGNVGSAWAAVAPSDRGSPV